MKEIEKIIQEALAQERKRLLDDLQARGTAAVQALEDKGGELLRTLEALAKMEFTGDMVSFYVRTGGKMWVSKRLFVEDGQLGPQVTYHARLLNQEVDHPTPRLDRWTYLLILIAFPEKPLPPDSQDDYGNYVRRDC